MIIEVDKRGFWRPRENPGPSLRRACKVLRRIGGTRVVEVGTGTHGDGAGNSIHHWLQVLGSDITVVDVDPDRLAEAEHAAGSYCLAIESINSTGLEAMETFPDDYIDLLYLDFWSDESESELDGEARSRDYAQIYVAARSKLKATSAILIDDTDHIHPWKHTEIVPLARKDGFVVKWTGRQTMLLRDES